MPIIIKLAKERRQNPKTPNPALGILTQHKRENWEKGGEGEKREKTKAPGLPSFYSTVLSATEVGNPGQRIFLCAPTSRMEDQTQHDDESYNQDNVGTGAEISTENDVLQSTFLERIILRVAW